MSVVIVNWTGGENDPFTYVSRMHKNAFEELGRKVRIINLGDHFYSELLEEHANGIDFALTWQGLGSGIKSTPSQLTTIWDDLRIPLLCYQADHPSLMPMNHNAASVWIRHVYFAASFASFANKYLPRKDQASYLELPSVYPKVEVVQFVGDHFVLPKNLDDNLKTYESWNAAPQKNLVEFLGEADSQIAEEFRNGNRKNLHDVVDDLLTPEAFVKIQQDFNGEAEVHIRFIVHNLLHKIYRNMVSEYLILELADMPIKIYGRGWDRFKAMNNSNHEFLDGVSFSDSAFQ